MRDRRRRFGDADPDTVHHGELADDHFRQSGGQLLEKVIGIRGRGSYQPVDHGGIIDCRVDVVAGTGETFGERQAYIETEQLAVLALLGEQAVMSKDLEPVNIYLQFVRIVTS